MTSCWVPQSLRGRHSMAQGLRPTWVQILGVTEVTCGSPRSLTPGGKQALPETLRLGQGEHCGLTEALIAIQFGLEVTVPGRGRRGVATDQISSRVWKLFSLSLA